MKENLAKKGKISAIIAIFFAIIMFVFALFGVGRDNNAKANEAQVKLSEEWQEEYVLGDLWTAPTSAEIKIGTTALPVVNSYLVYPDGKIYNKDSYELTQAGCYTAYFFAMNNGKEVSAKKEFYVYSQAHTVPDGAICEYRDQLVMADGASGLGVRLAEGTAYQYGSTIDISGANLNEPLATIYSFNSSIRKGAAGYNNIQTQILVLRLTDAYDSSNYVDIELSFDVEGRVNKSKLWSQGLLDNEKIVADGKTYNELTDNEATNYLKDGVDLGNAKIGDYRYGRYFRAGTSEVLPKGFKKNATGNKTSWSVIEYEKGVYYDLCERAAQLGNIWGPYGAEAVHNPKGNDPVEFYFDYETCKVYAQTYDSKGVATMVLVADLRCKDAYKNPFKGFTTGEVYLSIFGEWYKESFLDFEISSIYGVSGEDLKKETAHETNAPIIDVSVDNEKYGEIVIAKNEPFEIFDYSVLDVSPLKENFTKVYYQYGSERQITVGIKDGKFTPKNVGKYTIVYAAKDIYGNYAEKHVNLNSVNCKNDQSLYLSFAQDGDIQLKSAETIQVSAGKNYKLPTYSIFNANPFDVTLSMYLLRESNMNEKIFVDKEENTLTLYDTGNYTLVYEYKDVIQTKTARFNFSSIPSDEITIQELPTLPKYFIKDSNISLELGKTISFKEAGAEVVPTVYVSFDGKEYQEVDPDNIAVTGKELVKIKYVYQGEVLYETKNPIPIVDVGYADSLDMTKYFIGNFYKDENENRIQFTAKKESGSETLTFINPISFSNFKLSFEVLSETSKFERLIIGLSDYYDQDNKVTISYGKTATGSYYEIGDDRYEYTQAFVASNLLSYDAEYQQFKTYSGHTMKWKNAFPNDKVYLTLTLYNMTGESAIDISRINGQMINESSADGTKADFALVNPIGTYKIGSTLTIAKPNITDVLSPYLESMLFLSVQTPSGEYYTDENGKQFVNMAMESDIVDILLNSYGQYRIRYTYTDSVAYLNKDSRIIDVYVTDDEAPTLKLENGYNSSTLLEGKVSETISVAEYSVSDNVTSAENLSVSVVVISPDNIMETVTDDMKYTFYIKGEYTVYYICLDEAGNYTTVSYRIKVE